MAEFVECSTQADLDAAVKNGNIAVVRSGFFVAYDSSTVEAYDSSTVEAYDSSTVEAFGSSTVQATPFVAVQKHGTAPKITGGVLIQIPEIKTAEQFCEFYGLKPARGSVTLFKLVDDTFVSGHGTSYKPGEKPEAPDWNPRPACGEGLHFSPRAFMARKYAPTGTRFVACRVKVKDLVVIAEAYGQPDKCKARGCTVLHECDEDGVKLEAEAKAAA